MNNLIDFIFYFLITFIIMSLIGVLAFFIGLMIDIIAPFKVWFIVTIFMTALLSISTYEKQ